MKVVCPPLRVLVGQIIVCLAAWGAVNLKADELQPADKPLEEVVDFYVDLKLQKEGVTPAPPADDANFIRRVTLDLAGRIPTANEVQTYVQSSEPDKRVQLVDRLINSPDFAYHLRNSFDSLLMPTKNDGAWREYLLKAFQENRPWPQLFREMITGRDDNPAEKPALAFLKARARNLDDLTNDTSKLFFGVSINCAKCHDHPLVLDWLQDHYYGMSSFFNRTYLTKKDFLAERDEGIVKFKTTEGVEKEGKLLFLTGDPIAEPAPVQKTDAQKKADQARQKEEDVRETPPAPPAFSRRAQLVEAALKPDANGFFPRSFVNRVWDRLFGQGLVTPVDQMHSENPPSHGDLLRWLARDTVEHNYDLRRLTRGLVLSRAYGRSSRWDASADRPPARLLAVAAVRPLSPAQYSLSLLIGTANPDQMAQQMAKPEDWAKRRKDLENQASGFAQQIELPGENFQVSVSEALLFNNNQHIQNEYLRDSADRLVGVMKAQADRAQMIQTAYLSIFSRPVQPEELEATLKYVAAREDRLVAACQQVVWALITSAELRFNY